jgi:hypothetical protein
LVGLACLLFGGLAAFLATEREPAPGPVYKPRLYNAAQEVFAVDANTEEGRTFLLERMLQGEQIVAEIAASRLAGGGEPCWTALFENFESLPSATQAALDDRLFGPGLFRNCDLAILEGSDAARRTAYRLLGYTPVNGSHFFLRPWHRDPVTATLLERAQTAPAEEQRTIARLLRRYRPVQVERLQDMLDHRSPIIRRIALEEVGPGTDPAARRLVEEHLRDPHPRVRAEAQLALGRLSQQVPKPKPTLDPNI